MMWTNLYRTDYLDKTVQEAPDGVREAIGAAQRGLLRDEIRILGPSAIIFFTGPNYDDELLAEFPGVVLEPQANLPVREFARLSHSGLPPNSFRTYHPNYLLQSGKKDVLDLIAKSILQIEAA